MPHVQIYTRFFLATFDYQRVMWQVDVLDIYGKFECPYNDLTQKLL